MVFLITDATGTGMAGGPDGAAAATGPVRSEEKRIPAPTQTTVALPSKIFQCRMGAS